MYVLLIGHGDSPKLLKDVHIFLHLRHLCFEALLVILLLHGVYDEREALVFMVQLLPCLLQTLEIRGTWGTPVTVTITSA